MGKAFVFCGIKHSGKSTLGKNLARLLTIPFCDTDELLEQQYSTSVRELFKSRGETEFRRLESALLKNLSPATGQVISLGGGALLKAENTAIVRGLGTVIWCDVPDETAFQRILLKGLPPFLAGEADPFEAFCNNNKQRKQTFEKVCHIHFQPEPEKSPEENALSLLGMLKQKGIITQ